MIHFDVDMGATLQVAEHGDRLIITDVAFHITNTTVAGTNFFSRVTYLGAKALVDPLLAKSLQSLNTMLTAGQNEMQAILQPVTEVVGAIPNDALYFDVQVDADSGAIALCFKSEIQVACKFHGR